MLTAVESFDCQLHTLGIKTTWFLVNFSFNFISFFCGFSLVIFFFYLFCIPLLAGFLLFGFSFCVIKFRLDFVLKFLFFVYERAKERRTKLIHTIKYKYNNNLHTFI